MNIGLALALGLGYLGLIAWVLVAASITCFDLPVSRPLRFAANATMVFNGIALVGIFALAIGMSFL